MSGKSTKLVFLATVAKIIDPYTLVINKGSMDGIKMDQEFLIYEESKEDIIDPVTKESLGKLEIVKGTGEVVHLQKRMATIESVVTEPKERVVGGLNLFQQTSIKDFKKIPFNNAKIGDKAKPI